MAGMIAGDRAPTAWLRLVSDVDGEVVLELGGEVDLSGVAAVQPALDEVLDTKPTRVVFELRELTFLDSSGIALLIATAQRVARIELRYPSPLVRRVIQLTGLSATLPITS
jgi:stage II sporulation protein AA (anti-sigma F factor antagonist)